MKKFEYKFSRKPERVDLTTWLNSLGECSRELIFVENWEDIRYYYFKRDLFTTP